jgi:hypothetical protein
VVVAWACVHWGSIPCEGVATQDLQLGIYGLLVDVELGREAMYLALDGVPCIFMHLVEIGSCTSIHVDVLL